MYNQQEQAKNSLKVLLRSWLVDTQININDIPKRYSGYSEVSNKRAGWNKRAGLNFSSVLIIKQDGIKEQGGYLLIEKIIRNAKNFYDDYIFDFTWSWLTFVT